MRSFAIPRFRLRCCGIAALALVLVVPAIADGHNDSQPPEPPGPPVSFFNLCDQLPFKTGKLLPKAAKNVTNPCQVLEQNEKFSDEELQQLETIQDFLRKHRGNPDAEQLRQILLTNPQPGDTLLRLGDGTWQYTVPLTNPCPPNTAGCVPMPASEPIITLPFSGKVSGIFDSVRFTGDRDAQLNLYTDIYTHLAGIPGCSSPIGVSSNAVANDAGGCNFSTLPTPASLQGASLTDIASALTSLASEGNLTAVLNNLPVPSVPPSTADCAGETGTYPQQASYGDQTGNSASCVPTGLFAMLTNSEFPLRQYLTCVKNQGNRETCHTFAGISAAEMMVSQTFGVKANFSEEDFMEHYRFEPTWSPGYMHETGDAYEELTDAINNHYSFAYEDNWLYNPSYGRSFVDAVYVNSCTNIPPVGPHEPGCSDSAPQAPGSCFSIPFLFPGIYLPLCDIHDAGVAESPYKPTALSYFWNPNNLGLSIDYMILSVAFNEGVVLGFNVTDAFGNASNTGGYVVYNANDVQKSNGGHYVHVVGITGPSNLPAGAPAPVGGGYFIIKNSWDNCFGDGGYLYLDFAYVQAVGWAGFNVSGVGN
jgi:hypothetical protein